MSAALHRISIVFAAAAALALVAVVPAAAPARAGTILANFESYAEGSLGAAGFTDAASGIRFSEATAFGHNYVIEATTVARPALPSITPGHYLESNGYSPGDGISVSPITGFTLLLPGVADEVSLDFVYVGLGSLTVDGFNVAGALVATTTVTPPGGTFVEGHLTLTSPAGDISKVKLVPAQISIGYDNIRANLVPEPAGLTLILLSAGGFVVGRRRAQRQ